MKHYNTTPNWGKWQEMPHGSERERQRTLVGHLAKGNLHWFVRKLLGMPNDWAFERNSHEMSRRSKFLEYMDKL